MKNNRRILFVTGTRADYAKIRPIFKYIFDNTNYEISLYITGMHLMKEMGSTESFVRNDLRENFNDIKVYKCRKKISYKNSMIENFSRMCNDFERLLVKNNFDMVFVHGDRLEALSATIVSSVNNTPICHIEAGEVSGSIDESIRHSITKFSHKFLVNDEIACNRIIQLGEKKENIYILGPTSIQNEEYSIRKSEDILKKYNYISKDYAILIYHPVTVLKNGDNGINITRIMKQLEETDEKYIAIYPNSDKHSQEIMHVYEKYRNSDKFKFFRSIPFDEFNVLLKNSKFIIGNSSCGLKEAPYYNVPTIDIGERQANRTMHHNFSSIYHINNIDDVKIIINKVKKSSANNVNTTKQNFELQLRKIFNEKSNFWNVDLQKKFNDIGGVKNVFK